MCNCFSCGNRGAPDCEVHRDGGYIDQIDSLEAKVKKYEEYLHAINAAVVSGNRACLQQLIDNAFRWSYAHRAGNGELSVEEENAQIRRAFDCLTDTEVK
jgi:hypothetical protein